MLACHDRHYLKWRMGTSTDPELNRNHLAIAAWNLLCLMVYEKQGLGYDNRALPEEMTINDDMEWVELSEKQKTSNIAHNLRVREYSKEKHEKGLAEKVEEETIEVGDEVEVLPGALYGISYEAGEIVSVLLLYQDEDGPMIDLGERHTHNHCQTTRLDFVKLHRKKKDIT